MTLPFFESSFSRKTTTSALPMLSRLLCRLTLCVDAADRNSEFRFLRHSTSGVLRFCLSTPCQNRGQDIDVLAGSLHRELMQRAHKQTLPRAHPLT